MKITDIRMKKNLQEDNAVIAFCDLTIDKVLVIHGVKLVKGVKGTHVSFPSTFNKKEEKFVDVVHPIDQNFRNYITEEVINHYEKNFK